VRGGLSRVSDVRMFFFVLAVCTPPPPSLFSPLETGLREALPSNSWSGTALET
jgi:hypothetical protein